MTKPGAAVFFSYRSDQGQNICACINLGKIVHELCVSTEQFSMVEVFDSVGFSSMYHESRPEYPPEVFQYFVGFLKEKVRRCVSLKEANQTQQTKQLQLNFCSLCFSYNNFSVCPRQAYVKTVGVPQLVPPFSLAVDVGCGTGISTRPLVEYFDHVIGCDVSQSQIAKAIEMGTSEKLSFK